MLSSARRSADWWTTRRGAGPIIATAIHAGHLVRPEMETLFAISESVRLREEDPHSDLAGSEVPNQLICHRSRFEVDLNRDRSGAVYLRPEQSWGLTVWREPPAPELLQYALDFHSEFYRILHDTLSAVERQYGRFVLLDIHSYNHRRQGPYSEPTTPAFAPEVNIGTHSMPMHHWGRLVRGFSEFLGGTNFRDRRLDVRANVAFQGRGELTRFVHQHFPGRGCAIALEFKKFFMDEWTGAVNDKELDAIRRLVGDSVPVLEDLLQDRPRVVA